MKSDVTQGVYVVKSGSYILPNQAVREEERNGERGHHPAPEECQNILIIHPDRVAGAGAADNGPSENKKDSVPRNIWTRNMIGLDRHPTVRTGVSHRLIGKTQTSRP